MSRIDCISNRNTKIIVNYVQSKLGHYDTLFDGLPYPETRYQSPADFFLNEDEWITYETYKALTTRARDMVGEKYFYFNCGASSASLRSWGRLSYFIRIFASPCDGIKRLPFFFKNFSDMKELEVIIPPAYDEKSGKIRTVLKLQYHDDIDVNSDYIGDPYTRGIISSIPTIWGLRPATVKQPLNPFDPIKLLKEEPEFKPFHLDPNLENGYLSIKDPQNGTRRTVGKSVYIQPESVNGRMVFLGKYQDNSRELQGDSEGLQEAILITDTIKADNRIIFKSGEIFKAPYFIMEVVYDRVSFLNRLSQVFKIRKNPEDSGKELSETINRLRETMEARNTAYDSLEKSNQELKIAKEKVDDYARNLEEKVEERTAELREAQQELEVFNRNLSNKVTEQVKALKRYDELRRYLSPKLTEKILSSGDALGSEPQRKMMTVLFSDIRNFSALTDCLEPEELFYPLDRYISEMTKIIHRFDGTLNKIVGDGLMVFFGDPIPMEDHAERAVMMAIDMQKKAAELKIEWLQYGHQLGIGIGINSGYMTVGNIGSSMHRDYTVIGNQVNVAARLEGKAGPGEILISQRTLHRCSDLVNTERMGDIPVKGIHHPVATYKVIY
ncbi:adenylate/guanylate cyclase domain-containing protein [Thermodesulfobacteriota bacterium]